MYTTSSRLPRPDVDMEPDSASGLADNGLDVCTYLHSSPSSCGSCLVPVLELRVQQYHETFPRRVLRAFQRRPRGLRCDIRWPSVARVQHSGPRSRGSVRSGHTRALPAAGGKGQV